MESQPLLHLFYSRITLLLLDEKLPTVFRTERMIPEVNRREMLRPLDNFYTAVFAISHFFLLRVLKELTSGLLSFSCEGRGRKQLLYNKTEQRGYNGESDSAADEPKRFLDRMDFSPHLDESISEFPPRDEVVFDLLDIHSDFSHRRLDVRCVVRIDRYRHLDVR